MRNQVACPDCGYVLQDKPGDKKNGLQWKHLKKAIWTGIFTDYIPCGFTCPRCSAHYTEEDFWDEQFEKWSRKAKE